MGLISITVLNRGRKDGCVTIMVLTEFVTYPLRAPIMAVFSVIDAQPGTTDILNLVRLICHVAIITVELLL